jgi:effector-binding domain-containing protein
MTTTKSKFALIAVALLLTLFAVVAMAIEEPKYNLIEKSGKLELRAYEPMIIAEVSVDGSMDSASGRGFRLIADYIFGNNTASDGDYEKISMTAPVTMEVQPKPSEKIAMTTPVTMAQEGEQWRMHFVMPAEYTMQTLPKPNNPQINVREIPEQNYAAIRFSGFSGAAKVDRKTKELLAWMTEKGLEPIGTPELARYNPPITPPFFRRNEVLIQYR